MPNLIKGNHTSQPERFCKYIHRYCNQTRLDGYDYCIRHILEDKTAPFRQCIYVNQPNKKRCTNAAPKIEKNEKRDNALCPFHAKRALMKTKMPHTKKKVVVEGPAALLRYLEHYCSDPMHDPAYSRETGQNEKNEMAVCVGGRPTTLSEAEATFVDGEPIEEKAFIESVDDDFSWVEKNDDYLEHAGVYTDKEILTITKDKITKLQQLYCAELRVIYYQLKEKRRKFLAEMKKAVPSTSTSTEEQPDKLPEVDKNLLKALIQYHKCDSMEHSLRHKMQEKRSGMHKTTKAVICTFEKSGFRCREPAIVLTKFCKNHILSDPLQVMFKPCGLGRNCKKPVIPFEENATCDQHFHLALSRSKADETVQPLPALLLFSAVVTAWAGYSSSKSNNGYGYVLSNSRPYYTYKPYVITPTAVKPVYVAKPYYGYGNGYGYGQLHHDSYRPIWSSSNTADSYYPYYGYAGSYLYNPYYYGSYKHGIGYYPGYGYGDLK